MSKQRIYVVHNAFDSTKEWSLVRAGTPAQALRHVVRDTVTEVATQDQLVKLLADGVKVEDASEVRA